MTAMSSILRSREEGASNSTHPAAQIGTHAPYIDAMAITHWRVMADTRRPSELPTGIDRLWHAASARLVHMVPRRGRLLRSARTISAQQAQLEELSADQLAEQLDALRTQAHLGRLGTQGRSEALAGLAEVARRSLGLRPYPVQLAGALAMVQGRIAEMATGEGKTLTAALAAAFIAWRGLGCHVVTVNDYLAKRDADWARPFFAACGLTVAAVDQAMTPDQRAQAYAASITYATQKELAADYLRDRIDPHHRRSLATALIQGTRDNGVRHRAVMRGLHHAIIDEVDSVLIDEAATPLILSSQTKDGVRTEAIRAAAKVAANLSSDLHYRVDRRYREITLTQAGRHAITHYLNPPSDTSPASLSLRVRDELIHQAIAARELYLRNDHYVIDEGKLVIVDSATGRLMPGRTWRDGYHQAVEAKEGLEITPINETIARISFQQFFRSYRNLSGMTGTGYEERHEFWRVFRMPVIRIPRHRPLRRTIERETVWPNAEAKWEAVRRAVRNAHSERRPVLIGTTSVDDSLLLSQLLEGDAIPHAVLNAVHHQEEAMIVERAGQPGAVTVATNMAGRGTDIRLGPGVTEIGGLLVIAAVRNAAARIDRQLYGRCARQGQPGQVLRHTSLEDDLALRYLGRSARALAPRLPMRWRPIFLRMAQQRAERIGRSQRLAVIRSDDWITTHLGFAPDVV